ncbi:hypothetical protein H5203_21465 [Pseudoalteromonas sp. SG41-1]|uniref:hypothetical protein n=1 Tax=Pseudoalteromonas sp. SG41-1 TaxID=2760979 RepID=UPI001602070A|nr:hypothetical protein [Pseudoalteromonas sp. SG41-1]MBB1508015.1 hypothetical protein [Pseudoalteromonas sp. SG41-1]
MGNIKFLLITVSLFFCHYLSSNNVMENNREQYSYKHITDEEYTDHINNFSSYPLAYSRTGEKSLIEAQVHCSQDAIRNNLTNQSRAFDKYNYDFNNCMSQFIPFTNYQDDCEITGTLTWGNCSGNSSMSFVPEQSATGMINNTENGYQGQAVFQCNNGLLKPIYQVCNEVISSCEITEEQIIQQQIDNINQAGILRSEEEKTCQFTISPQSINSSESIVVEPDGNGYVGSLEAKCENGNLNIVNQSCELVLNSCPSQTLSVVKNMSLSESVMIDSKLYRYNTTDKLYSQNYLDNLLINELDNFSITTKDMASGEVNGVPVNESVNYRGENIIQAQVTLKCEDGNLFFEDFSYEREKIEGCAYEDLRLLPSNPIEEEQKWFYRNHRSGKKTFEERCGTTDIEEGCVSYPYDHVPISIGMGEIPADISDTQPVDNYLPYDVYNYSGFFGMTDMPRDQRMLDSFDLQKERIGNKTCYHPPLSTYTDIKSHFNTNSAVKIESTSPFYWGYHQYRCKRTYNRDLKEYEYEWEIQPENSYCYFGDNSNNRVYDYKGTAMTFGYNSNSCLFMGNENCGDKRPILRGEKLYCPEVFMKEEKTFICEDNLFQRIPNDCEKDMKDSRDVLASYVNGQPSNRDSYYRYKIKGDIGQTVNVLKEVEVSTDMVFNCEEEYRCEKSSGINTPANFRLVSDSCLIVEESYSATCRKNVSVYGNNIPLVMRNGTSEKLNIIVKGQQCFVTPACLRNSTTNEYEMIFRENTEGRVDRDSCITIK